jgi:glycogen debranching enzyme
VSTTDRRATPADPTPGLVTEQEALAQRMHDLPPELAPNAVALIEGPTFMYSNAAGDVPPNSIGGLVYSDTRYLSRWQVTLNGAPLLVLTTDILEYHSAAFYLTNSDLPGIRANSVCLRRLRRINGGLQESIELQTFTKERLAVQLRLSVGADFADLLEIKKTVRDRSAQVGRQHAPDGSRLAFSYQNNSFQAGFDVDVDPPASQLDGDDLVWDLTLEPTRPWRCELNVPLRYGSPELLPAGWYFGTAAVTAQDDATSRWRAASPRLDAESEVLRTACDKTAQDLLALRIELFRGSERIILPAAGLPWFLTLLGRDTLITAYQTLGFGPLMARGALLTLAAAQGREVNEFRDEEPGKILHEIRAGELTRVGELPYSPYFGTADATQPWLIVLSELWRWTRDDELVHGLRDNAYAALRWIDDYGDLDGDGFVEYATRSPQGLGNQCWRDSWDGIQYADASIPVLPIATCEIQGYTYDAKLRVAELAEGPLDDPLLARRLRAEADQLRQRFNRDFWIEERGGYYALGLDGDKRRIDAMTSNIGQLLWSGIVPRDRASIVARQLMSDHLFSGWGVRTTSTLDRCFNPIGYHMGTVWPHDNSLIAHGLARYGFRDEANRIIMGMLDAARYFDHRLPEAFSGYDRSHSRVPVSYQNACSPQAWASAAPLLFIRTMLGMDAQRGRITLDPAIPAVIGRIQLTGTYAFGQRWDMEATRTHANVRLSEEPDVEP